MSKWQPIETAPKDGTIVDLWFPLLDDDGDYEEYDHRTEYVDGSEEIEYFGDDEDETDDDDEDEDE